jgi:hypothetical protein
MATPNPENKRKRRATMEMPEPETKRTKPATKDVFELSAPPNDLPFPAGQPYGI